MSSSELASRLEKDILVLDGAMGTMIMQADLSEKDFRGERFKEHPVDLKGCNDILVLTRPEVINRIHLDYLYAGADIISTDTFNANRLSLADYHLDSCVAEICREAARIAHSAIEDFVNAGNRGMNQRPLVAGSMGPTGISLSISDSGVSPGSSITCFENLAAAYEEQATALVEGGVDLLLLETVFDTLNAKAASIGIKRAFRKSGREVPLIISATLSLQGRLLSGQSIEEFVDALSNSGAIAFGLNCGFGAEALAPMVERLAIVSPSFVSMHPNAGLPDDLGHYHDSPEKMLEEIIPVLRKRILNIIGGCCGTTPDHIRRIASEVKKYSPRRKPDSDFHRNSFVKIGERCNVAGSRKFLRLVKENNWRENLDIAALQVDKGAAMLDINMDDALIPGADCMERFITLLRSDPRTSDMPLMIDSSDFNVVERALPLLPLKGIVNSISLKNGESEFIRRARYIYDMGCDMVVMAFDERGQADTTPRRIEIFSRAFSLLEKEGIPASSIVFDPNVLAVATGIESHSRYALDFLESVSWIKKNLPGARVSGGVSNLSFSFRGIDPVRKAMHSVFLELAISRGMDMAIINPATPLSSSWINPELKGLIEDLLLCRRNDATERLLAYALELKKRLDEEKALKSNVRRTESTPKRELSPCDSLASALQLGDSSRLEDIIPLAVKECEGSAMKVVENALMKGMDRVGADFASGNIFLPQVVRSADVMKRAVAILTPLLEEEQRGDSCYSEDSLRPKVVLATVKGDVHDIGKNIVAIVLRCSGFDVVDLGVMTPPEKIVDTAVGQKAVAIGLSGLITPSLHEMGVVAELMEKKGMSIPLFVGGATTSDMHTAVRLSPLYSGAVVRTGDAASLPGVLSEFTSARKEKAFDILKEKQKLLRDEYYGEDGLLSLEEARRRGAPVAEPASAPLMPGSHLLEIPIKEILPLVNWRPFLHEWRLYPSDQNSPEASRLLKEANEIIAQSNGCMHARVIIMPAKRDGDDIIVDSVITIPTLRSLTPNPVTGKCLALSDFIAESGDHIAFFAVTAARSGLPEMIEKFGGNDSYKGMLLQSVSHRLAEAATEWTHLCVRERLWGISARSGIRPAVGYSSLPDQSLVNILDQRLEYASLGIKITENGALKPSATTTGLIIAHQASRYFDIGRLTPETIADYSSRRGIDCESLKKWINV